MRLVTGSLVVFSPVGLTREARATLDGLGNHVRYLVAPDIEHYLSLREWKEAYPSAKVIAPAALVAGGGERAPKAVRGLQFDHLFSSEAAVAAERGQPLRVSDEFDAEFTVEYVDSHVNREIVLLHRPSRTLIEADLLFTLPATTQFSQSGMSVHGGIWKGIANSLLTAEEPATWQRRAQCYVFPRDRAQYTKAVRRIHEWDFDRLIPCHGEVIETGGKAIFETVFEHFVNGNKG